MSVLGGGGLSNPRLQYPGFLQLQRISINEALDSIRTECLTFQPLVHIVHRLNFDHKLKRHQVVAYGLNESVLPSHCIFRICILSADTGAKYFVLIQGED